MHVGQVPSQLSFVLASTLLFILDYFLQEPLDNEHPLPITLITYANNDQGTKSKSCLATEEKGHCKAFLMFSTAHAQGRKRYFPGKGEDGWLGGGDHAAHPPSRLARSTVEGGVEFAWLQTQAAHLTLGRGHSTLYCFPHMGNMKRKRCSNITSYGCGEKLVV